MSDFGCENAAAIAAAPNVFTSMEDLAVRRCEWRPREGSYPAGLLGPSCHLFARKCALPLLRLLQCFPDREKVYNALPRHPRTCLQRHRSCRHAHTTLCYLYIPSTSCQIKWWEADL